MLALRAISQNLRRLRYRWHCRRDLSDALVAYESVFQEILSDLYPTPAVPRRLRIDFDWICSFKKWDAEAVPGNWVHERMVRLTICWFYELQGITNEIFKSRDMFPKIGVAEKDRFNYAELRAGAAAGDERDTSTDSLRQEASCVTVEIALAMIVLHEIGHHAFGHMELDNLRGLKYRESDVALEEVSSANVPSRQACEIDADRFSFSRVLELAAGGRSPFTNQLVSPPLTCHLFSLATLAYWLVIALLHTRNDSLERFETAAHPHPAVRLLASQSHFTKYFARDDKAAAAYQTAWQETLRVIEHNEDQKHTLSLLAQQRPLLEEKVAQLDAVIKQNLRKATKRFDFSRGEWLEPTSGEL